MQEIRCEKCKKLLVKIIGGKAGVRLKNGGESVIEIQCPHNYRDENGKNVQCKTLNKIVI